MHFDAKAVNLLLQMSDSQLWAFIQGLAQKRGIKLPAATPSPGEMQALRRAIGSLENQDMGKALSLLKNLERKEGPTS